MSIINGADTTLDNLTVLTCILHTLKSGILTRTCHLSKIVGRIRFWRKNRVLEGSDCIMFVFQGEYIAPEKIEVLYDRSPLVGQVLIYGDSLKSNLVAIIIPDELAVQAWADSKGISASFEDICLREDLNAEIIKQVGIPPSPEYISSLGREKLLEKKNFRKNCYYIQNRADI